MIAGGDLSVADYNGRTPLHQASAEGHLDIVKLLVEQFKIPPDCKDRWDTQKSWLLSIWDLNDSFLNMFPDIVG